MVKKNLNLKFVEKEISNEERKSIFLNDRKDNKKNRK